MAIPKKTKFRKYQRGRIRGKASRGNKISFGDIGIQSLECGYLTERQIEAARRAMTRHIKRGGKIWIRIFPDKNFSSIPAETRMGKGKGQPAYWAAPIKAGTVLFEIAGIEDDLAKEALHLAMYKLPLKTKVLKKDPIEVLG